MKATLLALALTLGFSTAHAKTPAAPAPAKFQFFVNYNNGKYDGTFSSTARAPISAAYLMDNYALCYKGSIPEVVELFEDMMAIFHAEYPKAKISARLKPFHGTDGKLYLKIQFKHAGYTYGYPKVRACVR